MSSSGTSLGRSTSLPFSNLAPARTSATRCGPLTARQRRPDPDQPEHHQHDRDRFHDATLWQR
jgi:hypothetical protein